MLAVGEQVLFSNEQVELVHLVVLKEGMGQFGEHLSNMEMWKDHAEGDRLFCCNLQVIERSKHGAMSPSLGSVVAKIATRPGEVVGFLFSLLFI